MKEALKILAVLLLAGCLTAGCDKKEEAPKVDDTETATQESKTAESETGPISVGQLRVVASQSTLLTEGAPAADQVKKSVIDALYATPSFEADGTRAMKGSLTYDIRRVTKQDGGTAIDVALFGDFKLSGQAQTELSAKVIVGNEKAPDSTPQDLLSKAIEKFSKQLDGQARVMASQDGDLLDFISDESEEASARLVAVQEARDRRLTGASNTIEPLLADEDERLQVAAAAALVAFEKKDTYSKVIGVAEQFSRDRNPQLMPMLYIIGDMNTDESKIYLKTVAEAHSEPTVQKIAQEALNRGKGAGK